MPRNINKLQNQLWQARKRLGLQQKHVALFLNHKTTDQVSRYEKGYRIPGLKILLQLEIIYGIPPRIIYRDYYEELRAKIEEQTKALKVTSNVSTVLSDETGLLTEFCGYEEFMRNPNLSQTERDAVRKHTIVLVRRLSDLAV